jgi:uncharacterized protein (TIGR02145 family)
MLFRLFPPFCAVGFLLVFTELHGQSVGCNLPYACNYDETVTTLDPSTCIFDNCSGCTYANASNFNPSASIDDGSCFFEGCTDEGASNYEPLAETDDGSCVECPPNLVFPEDVTGDGVVSILDLLSVLATFGEPCEDSVPGCLDPECLNYSPEATEDDGSCECLLLPENNNLADALPLGCGESLIGSNVGATNPDSSLTGSSYAGVWYSVQVDSAKFVTVDMCTAYNDLENPLHDPVLTVFEFDESGTELTMVAYNDDACGPKPSVTWHATANQEFFVQVRTFGGGPGGDFRINSLCSDSDPFSAECEGSGVTSAVLTVLTDCWPSETAWSIAREDGVPWATSALNDFLGQPQTDISWNLCLPNGCYTLTLTDVYGDGLAGAQWSDCDADGDLSLVTTSGETLIQLGDPEFGYSVSFDFCVESNFVAVQGCTDSDAINYDPDANQDDGSCAFQGTGCFNIQSFPFDGYEYDVILIAGQCWFTENLRSTHYANGDEIPGNLSDSQWAATTEGAQAVYENDPNKLADYGRLYNHNAITDARQLCPAGWKVPSDEDWMELEMALGMDFFEATTFGFRGWFEGAHLKSTPEDEPPWDGANFFGFSALPGGMRSDDGAFSSESMGYWWSSDALADGISAINRLLATEVLSIAKMTSDRAAGYSVRCLADDYFENNP